MSAASSSLTQVVHAKMVALDWLRFAGSSRAHVPWWREADSAWRSAAVHAPVRPATAAHAQPAATSGAGGASKPTRVASHVGDAHPCIACSELTTDVLYLSHVSHPHWSICSSCSKSF